MCLIVLIGLAFPRFALFLTWLFSDRISRAIDSNLLAFAGFLVLPFTTFFYVLAWAPVIGVTGLGWFFVAFGFLLDIGSYSSGGAYGRRRNAARQG